MGYYYEKHWNGQSKYYTPDDTSVCFYIKNETTLTDIIERCKDKWGEDIDMNKITITPEYIHTDCIGYDLYDAGDYTNYLCIEYNP